MRVLHTFSGLNLGGLEFRILDQLAWLQAHGHTAVFAGPSRSETLALARQRGLPTLEIDFDSPYSVSTIRRLRTAVRQMGIHVIDSHGAKDGRASALCRDLCTLVRTWHFARKPSTSWRRRLEWRLGCHRVIATSRSGAGNIVAAGFAPRHRVSVVGEWAAPGFFASEQREARRHAMRRALALAPRSFVVATVGMLRPEKGQAELVRVVHLLLQRGIPAVALVVGKPTQRTLAYEQAVRDLAMQLEIEKSVIFTGHREDIGDVLQAVDAVLVPSSCEAWSRIIPEAFASRCPVVASDVGGIPEIVQPRETGWLCGAGDTAGFADRIADIWANPHIADQITERARKYAERHFSISVKMSQTLEAYETALTTPRSGRSIALAD